MKSFLPVSMLAVAACDRAPTFDETCERIVVECRAPAENLPRCKAHGEQVTAAAEERGCRGELDDFLACAHGSEVFCGAMLGSGCEAEVEALTDCGVPIF